MIINREEKEAWPLIRCYWDAWKAYVEKYSPSSQTRLPKIQANTQPPPPQARDLLPEPLNE